MDKCLVSLNNGYVNNSVKRLIVFSVFLLKQETENVT